MLQVLEWWNADSSRSLERESVPLSQKHMLVVGWHSPLKDFTHLWGM